MSIFAMTNRRGALGVLSALGLSAMALALAPVRRVRMALDDVRRVGRGKRWWGMAIDLDLCTSCGACVVACKSENNVALTGAEPEKAGTAISWMELVPKVDGADGNGATGASDVARTPMELLPTPCLHCENPPCVKVCPVNATYQNDEGLVAMIYDRCIGCRYCEMACPYSRRYFNWSEPQWPESFKNLLNPDVATRPEGVIEKCTFCSHRLRKARETARLAERELADAELQKLPACAQSCPANAITFGDLADSTSLVSRLSRSPRVFRLLEHLGARPKVFYLARDRREG
jgi:molybdopterin-containing oxidoreductase family iron-sulfur binding subunit